MFTGLVQALGTVARMCETPSGRRLAIDPMGWEHRPSPGDSIAVSGVCLTLAGDPGGAGGLFEFDVIPQTLAETALGGLAPGSRVNLEHSMRADTLIGGHFVQGHADGVATVDRLETEGEWRVRLRVGPRLAAYLPPRGSVALDGVSLTIAETGSPPAQPGVGDGETANAWFEVCLIPETLQRTTLGDLVPGSRVNLECDMLVKAVVHAADVLRGRD